jgi:hypothetical protein
VQASEPTVFLYVPPKQATQLPAGPVHPAAQSTGSQGPPAGPVLVHTQSVCAVLPVPPFVQLNGGHCAQVTVLLTLENVFAGHGKQALVPSMLLYVPIVHNVHAGEVPVVPAGHCAALQAK